MRINLLTLLLLLPLIAFSGCTTITGGNGLVIEAFEPEFSSVFTGEPVSFLVQIRNAGSVDSSEGQIEIIGLDTVKWTEEQRETIGKLLAADPVYGTQGETWNHIFEYSAAPEVPQGISVTYQPTARLSYNYRTTIVKSVTVASRDELKNMQNLGVALPSETVSVSSSPVQITIKNEGPIRFWGSEVTFPVEITIDNVGGGVVCFDSYTRCSSPDDWNRIKVDVDHAEGIDLSDCLNTPITLFKGKTNTVTCQARVSDLSHVGVVQKTLKITADYGYFVDRTTLITVNWRETPGFG